MSEDNVLWDADGDLWIKVTETLWSTPGDLQKPFFWYTEEQIAMDGPTTTRKDLYVPTNDAEYALYEEWRKLAPGMSAFSDWLKTR